MLPPWHLCTHRVTLERVLRDNGRIFMDGKYNVISVKIDFFFNINNTRFTWKRIKNGRTGMIRERPLRSSSVVCVTYSHKLSENAVQVRLGKCDHVSSRFTMMTDTYVYPVYDVPGTYLRRPKGGYDPERQITRSADKVFLMIFFTC